MATKQSLAQALSSMLGITPSYIQTPGLQPTGGPSLLGNMTASPATSRGIGGTGGTGVGGSPDFTSAWDTMTNAEKAAYYAENPTMSAITQLGQKGFGFTGLGMAQNYLNPGFVNEQGMIARGIDPGMMANATNVPTEQQSQNNFASFMDANATNVPTEQQSQDAFDSYMNSGAPSYSSQDQAGGEAASASGNDNASDASPDGYAKGGRVDRNRLRGPDPRGPDQGYAPLQSGEYVIKKDAVNKYGEGMLGKINSGKFAKQ
jgi:hypothetical protein